MHCGQRMMKRLPVFAMLLVSALPLTAWSADVEPVQVARYSTMAPVPRAAQIEPLSAIVSITFPDRVREVGDALRFLLRRSGYQLAAGDATDPAAQVLMQHPLPAVHRELGPVTLQRALTTLAGPAWKLIVDPVHRLLSFELAPPYVAMTRNPVVAGDEESAPDGSVPADDQADCDVPYPCQVPSK